MYAFTRAGDSDSSLRATSARPGRARRLARTARLPPEPLDAAIIFAPVGALVPAALRAVAKGGSVVCGGIHMSDIPAFAYRLLWGERVLRSVANLTRRDGEEFLALAPRVPVRTEVERFALGRSQRRAGRAALRCRAWRGRVGGRSSRQGWTRVGQLGVPRRRLLGAVPPRLRRAQVAPPMRPDVCPGIVDFLPGRVMWLHGRNLWRTQWDLY